MMNESPGGSATDRGPAAVPGARRALEVALPPAVWLITTVVFWIGYVGADDLYYGRFAALWHRPPMNWWEFRVPAILAIRASFLALGASEFAAALPSLIASLLILASVAWFVDWPRTRAWTAQAAMLLAATFPLEVGFRTVPLASVQAAGLLALGTACLVKGRGWVPFGGASALALAFATHETSLFYVAILCLTALGFDRRRFWRPVLTCVLISGLLVAAECIVYGSLLGDPLARYRLGAGAVEVTGAEGYDPDSYLGGLRFHLWPIRNLVFCRQFGPDLGVLLACGIVAWRRLTQDQRLLFLVTFLVWGYLGYGSLVPWAYKPFYREFHYYPVLTLGICALLPTALAEACQRPRWLAPALASGLIVLHLALAALAGNWGQQVDVARELLQYARAHPERSYVTDVGTLNSMYALKGYRLPGNVVCLNGPAVEQHLLANKEPPGTPWVRFPGRSPDGILLNWDQLDQDRSDPEFARFVARHRHDGAPLRIAPVRYRLLLAPLVPLVGPRGFLIRRRGGEVIERKSALRPTGA